MLRSDILRGPAIVQFQSQTFYSQGDIKVDLVNDTFPINVSNFGKVDDRIDKVMHKLSFVPDGRFAALSVLLPYATATIGSSVFGTDKPLTIWTVDGKKRVYAAGAVTKMPNLMLGSTKTIFGDVEFTCIHAEASDWSTQGSLFVDSAASYPGDTGYLASDIITQPYALAWKPAFTFTAATNDVITASAHGLVDGTRVRFTTSGTLPAGLSLATDYYVRDAASGTFKVSATLGGSAVDITDTGSGTHTCTAGWASFYSKEGVSVEFSLQLAPEETDLKGLYDMTFQSLEVSAKFQPDGGPTVQDITSALRHQGSGSIRGRSINSGSSNLNITGTGVYVRLYNANIVAGAEAYGPMSRRVQPCEFRSTRSITAGSADPLFYVGTSAPA